MKKSVTVLVMYKIKLLRKRISTSFNSVKVKKLGNEVKKNLVGCQ